MKNQLFTILSVLIFPSYIQAASNDAVWLNGDRLALSIEPSFGQDPESAPAPQNQCYRNYCLATSTYLDSVFESCNVTITNHIINAVEPPKPSEVKRLFSDCLCGGDSKDGKSFRESILSSWNSCTLCLETSKRTMLNVSLYFQACQCIDPQPIDLLLNLNQFGQNSSICKSKKPASRTHSGLGRIGAVNHTTLLPTNSTNTTNTTSSNPNTSNPIPNLGNVNNVENSSNMNGLMPFPINPGVSTAPPLNQPIPNKGLQLSSERQGFNLRSRSPPV